MVNQMKQKLALLIDKLDENNLDSILITDLNNVRYFSGFTGTTAYLIITKHNNYLITDFRYIEQANGQCPDFEIIDHNAQDVELLTKQLENTGFENETISYKNYIKFEKLFKKLICVNDLITTLREKKYEDEIINIKHAVKIADDAFTHICKYAKEGMSEIEVANELEFYMRKNGAEKLSFDTIVASGARGAMPHGYPTDKKLVSGELVVLDFGCFYNGYASDMTRTLAVGNVDDKLIDVYNTVLDAQMSVLKVISDGQSASLMHKTAQDIIDKKYINTFGHALGHGVGLEIHELPTLSPKSKKILEVGNVVSVEPGIYIPGLCGVRIEDLVYITKNGCEVLTKSTKKLIYI